MLMLDVLSALVHIVNFNGLDSVLYILKRYPHGCHILEPVLQNP